MSDHELSRLSRLTSILTQLKSKRLTTATQLAKKYDVSVRTIYRDIRSLESSGIPIVTEEGRGYYLLEGYTLPPVMFTEAEANALITGLKLISRNKDASLIKAYTEAISKIKSVMKAPDKEKAELLTNRVAFLSNYNNVTTSDMLSTVQIAITRNQPIEIKYNSLYKNKESLRVVEPLALYHTQDNWILIAFCRLRKDSREFRLDRILTIKMLSEQLENRNFDLMKYFQAQLAKTKLNP